jgi:hypothetical protein
MLNYLWDVGDKALSMTSRLDRHQWLVVLLSVVVVGWFSLRGFGAQGRL